MAVFARISRLFRGFFGLFVTGLEERNPEALMEAARQEWDVLLTDLLNGVLEVDIPLGPAPDHKAGQTLDEVQREQILRVLEHTGWRIRGNGGAGQILDILPTTLESRMKRLGIFRRPSPARS